jgi:histone H1/5
MHAFLYFQDHPPYLKMVEDAIHALKERKGSSKDKILKYILKNYQLSHVHEAIVNTQVKSALRRGVDAGTLTQKTGVGASGSFKLNKEAIAKEEAKKQRKRKTKSDDKKDAPKKSAPKKARKVLNVKQSALAKKVKAKAVKETTKAKKVPTKGRKKTTESAENRKKSPTKVKKPALKKTKKTPKASE